MNFSSSFLFFDKSFSILEELKSVKKLLVLVEGIICGVQAVSKIKANKFEN